MALRAIYFYSIILRDPVFSTRYNVFQELMPDVMGFKRACPFSRVPANISTVILHHAVIGVLTSNEL